MASRDGNRRSTTPTRPGSQGSTQRGSPSTIRSYLQPVTALDSNSQDTLKTLLRLTVELRLSTSQTRRIQRGSPGAGALGCTLAQICPQVNDISGNLKDIFATYTRFPGMYLAKAQFSLFKDVLNSNFNDGGNESGYNERVHLLEKLMYVTGMLRGHLEMILEQHSYWKAKLAGEKPSQVVRRLDFNKEIDPASAHQSDVGLGGLQLGRADGGLFGSPQLGGIVAPQPLNGRCSAPSVDSAHKERPLSQNTFKVSVFLPEEVQAAVASLWENQKHTDITFLINGHPVPAHKAILASHSEYFERMLFGELKEASMDKITLKDVPLEAFQQVLQYAYSGMLHIKECTLQAVLEVVAVADRFSFVALKEALGDQLSSRISLNTVIPLLVHSDTYHLLELHKRCLCFIESKSNTAKVLQSPSFLDLPEENLIGIISRDSLMAPELAIFQAVVRWKKHNEKSAKELVKVLKHIRLTEFSPQEIFNEVEPTKLFSQERILTAVRLQYKPSVVETHPRGRKEANQNLFTKSTVVFDPMTPPTYYQPPQQTFVSYQTPPQQCIADAVIQLGFPKHLPHPTLGQASQPRWQNSHGSAQLDGNTTIVALDDSYIINYLHLKGYPGLSDEEQVSKSFSYTVKVSRDKSNWLELFDYSSFACRGAQHLPFPKQAARYIRVQLTGRQDTTQPTPLQLSACCYVENLKPFKFLSKGVIAPQHEQKVVTIPSTVTIDNNKVCVAYFRQPYSASFITFCLKCSDPSIVKADITVSVGVSSNLEERETLQVIERAPLQSQVNVETHERVIGYVAVTIRKAYKNTLSPTPHQTKDEKFGLAIALSTAVQEMGLGVAAKRDTSPSGLGKTKPASGGIAGGLQLGQPPPTVRGGGSGSGGGGVSIGGAEQRTTSTSTASSAGQLLLQPPLSYPAASGQEARGGVSFRSPAAVTLGRPLGTAPIISAQPATHATTFVRSTQQQSAFVFTPGQSTLGDFSFGQAAISFGSSTQPQPVASTAQAAQAAPSTTQATHVVTPPQLALPQPPPAAVSTTAAPAVSKELMFTIVDVVCRATL